MSRLKHVLLFLCRCYWWSFIGQLQTWCTSVRCGVLITQYWTKSRSDVDSSLLINYYYHDLIIHVTQVHIFSSPGFSKWPCTQRPSVRSDPGARLQPTAQHSMRQFLFVRASNCSIHQPLLLVTSCPTRYRLCTVILYMKCLRGGYIVYASVQTVAFRTVRSVSLAVVSEVLQYLCCELVFPCGRKVWWVVRIDG